MDSTSLIYIFLHSTNYTLELALAILFLATSRLQPDRGRLFMGLFLLITIAVSLFNISYALYTSTKLGNEIISLRSSVTGFPVFFMLMLYLVECHYPNEYGWRDILKLLMPWIIVAVPTMFLCFPDGGTHLSTMEDYFRNIHKPDVIFRTLSLLIFPVYGLWCFLMPLRNSSDLTTRPMTSLMCWCTALMTVTYIVGLGLHITLFYVLHAVFYILICLMSLYSEFSDRLQPDILITIDPECPTTEDTPGESVVAQRLRQLMEEEKPWKKPDLMQTDIARALGTNIKYVQNAIKELGYSSYSDMINSKRINYVKDQLDQDSEHNLKILFYNAGFRSRITAWRSFSKYVGCSPKEYSERQTKE